MLREPLAEAAPLERLARVRDARDRDVLHEHVRRLEHETPHALAAVERRVHQRDRSAVRVPDQDRALDPELVEQRRQEDPRLLLHVVERARQCHGIRAAVAQPAVRLGHQRRCSADSRREIPPLLCRAEPLVQEQERRRRVRDGAEVHDLHALAEHLHLTRDHSRSLYRWTFPVAVFGNSLTNSIQRGYLYIASFDLTKACSSRPSTSLPT